MKEKEKVEVQRGSKKQRKGFSLFFRVTFIFALLFQACSPQNIPIENNLLSPSNIHIESLKVLNLSEDMSAISTKSDEVVVNIFLLEKENNDSLRLVDFYYSSSMTFANKGESKSIDEMISIEENKKNKSIAIFTLVELDKEDSIKEIQEILKTELLKGQFLKRVDHLHMDAILGFDDFLGIHIYEIYKMKKGQPQTLKFKGRQLFDKFEYHLNIFPQ